MKFELSEKEMESYNSFVNKHKLDCPILRKNTDYGIGFIFKPSSLGCVVKLKCKCGTKVNITDYSIWK